MAIANEKILKKMMAEIQQAKLNEQNQEKMIKHIEKVQLLCELLLDEESVDNKKIAHVSEEISPEEMKAMLGKSEQPTTYRRTSLDEDDANGNSIFDF